MNNSENTKKTNDGKKAIKVINIVFTVFLYIFLAFSLFLLVISITSKRDADGAVNLFGAQARIVLSPSMEKCDQTDVSAYEIKDIPVKSMVFIELVPENSDKAQEWYSKLQVGDVLTFRYVYTRQETITHRITQIQPTTGGYIITLTGDNKNDDSGVLSQTVDTSLADSPNYIVGKVTGQSVFLGTIVYAIKQPLGIALIIILPCSVIIIYEVIKLVSYLTEGKKKKQQEEIEQLKSQLEALKNQNDNIINNDK